MEFFFYPFFYFVANTPVFLNHIFSASLKSRRIRETLVHAKTSARKIRAGLPDLIANGDDAVQFVIFKIVQVF